MFHSHMQEAVLYLAWSLICQGQYYLLWLTEALHGLSRGLTHHHLLPNSCTWRCWTLNQVGLFTCQADTIKPWPKIEKCRCSSSSHLYLGIGKDSSFKCVVSGLYTVYKMAEMFNYGWYSATLVHHQLSFCASFISFSFHNVPLYFLYVALKITCKYNQIQNIYCTIKLSQIMLHFTKILKFNILRNRWKTTDLIKDVVKPWRFGLANKS